MVGVVVPLYPRTLVDLTSLQVTTAFSAAPVTVIRSIPLYSWRSAALGVRVSTNDLDPYHLVRVRVVGSLPDPESPNVDFPYNQYVDLLLDSSTPAPGLFVESFATPLPAYADLEITLASRDLAFAEASVGDTNTLTLEIDLFLRGRFGDFADWQWFDNRGTAYESRDAHEPKPSARPLPREIG